MSTENWNSGNMLSEFVDKVSFANYLPLLTRATAENDEPTAGYMLKEIEKITFQIPPHCQHLAEYLNRRLEKPSPSVKLKVLKIMSHLIQNGHLSFRNYLRRNDGAIKMAIMYSGPPDPLLGVALYENVRRTAQGLLDMLFHYDLLQQDETQPDERTSLQLGGLGSTGSSKGKYEGFGSSPLDKEESVKDKMMDMLEKLVNPIDDTAEKIKSALTSSPGDYEAVPIEVQAVISHPEPRRIVPRPRAHVPGRAGGGWESDDDIVEIPKSMSTSSGSTVSADSLERIDPSSMETNPVRDIVVEFCSAQEWPLLPSQLNEVCKKCSSFNYADVLEVLGRQLLEQASDVSLLRALLMLEWFVRTDLATPAAFSTIVLTPLDRASKLESTSEAVRLKARKIQLILNKLQQR